MKFYGNKTTLRLLKYALVSPKNTYVFKGPKGVGKATIAKRFVKKLLCLTPDEKGCECDSCKKIKSGNHPDLIMIEPEGTSIKKEQSLYIKRETATKPLLSKYKVFIIDDANLMTDSAQNSLLKTIEDGLDFNIFIFIAHGNLLSTVESRAGLYLFQPLTEGEMKSFLKDFNIPQFKKEVILAASQGSIGTAKTLLESEIFNNIYDVLDKLYELHTLSELDILKLFNQLKEKDKNSFYEVFGDFLLEFLYILKTFFMDIIKARVGDKHIHFKSRLGRYKELISFDIKTLNRLVLATDKAIEAYQFNKFTKNEFFDLVREVAYYTNYKEDEALCQ